MNSVAQCESSFAGDRIPTLVLVARSSVEGEARQRNRAMATTAVPKKENLTLFRCNTARQSQSEREELSRSGTRIRIERTRKKFRRIQRYLTKYNFDWNGIRLRMDSLRACSHCRTYVGRNSIACSRVTTLTWKSCDKSRGMEYRARCGVSCGRFCWYAREDYFRSAY